MSDCIVELRDEQAQQTLCQVKIPALAQELPEASADLRSLANSLKTRLDH
jgi:hypothetical protein